jgi:outer membrane immunogenic protein
MKRSLLAGVAIIALSGGSALAADMPVKAPPIVCPACDWSGFYVGVNAGGSIGRDHTNDSIALNPPGAFGAVAPGVVNPISNTAYSQTLAGGIAGGQAGFNWQSGKFVFGVEADWDWSGQRDNLQVNNWLASSTNVAPSGYIYNDEHKLNWLATVRGRLGWTTGNSLWYVTGGAAWGGVQSNYTFQAFNSPFFATNPAAANFGTSTKSGWTVGGGAETSLAWMGMNHWSAKIEYLYVDLGTTTNTFAVPVPGSPAPGGPSAYTVTSTSHIRDNLIRLGLNYRFGGEKWAPVPPSPGPCPTCNWTGFYVGVNAGGSIGQDRARDTDQLLPPTVNSANVTNPLTDVSHTLSPVGGLAGGQLGYNWQVGNFVIGAEGDFDWSGQRDSFSNTNFVASIVVVAPAQVLISTEQKIEWLSTLRGRVGWTENCFLWYVTGGAAWGKVDANYAFQSVQPNGGTIFTTAPFAANTSSTKSGYTVGGGVETQLTWLGASNHWSAKMEYLYVDLGSIANTFNVPTTVGNGVHSYTSTSNIRDHIIRVGLNYRFDAPVTAKY